MMIQRWLDCRLQQKLLLSELDHLASPDFAGQPEKFEFEWWYKPDSADFDKNLLPVIDPATGEVSNANGWILYTAGSGKGKNNITLGEGGESGLLVLSDNWFLARYRGYNVGRDRNVWSPWIGDPSSLSTTWPMLAEGWVKRVVRGLNPFDERVKNLSEASASARISMLEQAGTRYEGDIAFNPSADAINKVGLIEAYETVLRQARSLSTDGTPPVNYAPANNALLLMASRIADLYTLLGNEAVADAVDPTIGFSTSSEYGSIASSIFAFQNQLESLLEEELTLLRGRDDSSAGVQGAPVYNRLLWNFTMGEGEVAYTQVYGIKDVNGDGGLNEYDASIMYPQGHGDAWGHYLTATKTYYDLLRNDSFTWVPRSESVLLAGVPIKVDFLDERKFALAASYKAKAGQQIVDLTYRNKYVQSPQGQWQGYSDTDSDRAWGVDEWATRAGVGAYLDWAMANAILPAVDPNPSHTGIDKIDRTTVKELREIASYFGKIQQTVNDADQGLNPLGLAQGVVPFDLDPTFVTGDFGKSLTHFEQIYDRARTALDNAVASFNQVNVMNVGIRQSSDQARDMDYDLKQQESDYNSQLVEFFGYPYAGDIGPGKTYPSGYDGPDLLHYMYVETKEYDSSNSPAGSSWTGILSQMDTELATWGNLRLRDQDLLNSQNAFSGTDIIRVDYPYSASGYAFEAPSSWGMRRAPGEVQLAISDLVQAETRLKQALKEYDALLKDIDEAMYRLDGEIDFKKEEITLVDNAKGTRTGLLAAQMGFKITQTVMNRGANLTDGLADSIAEAIPKNLIAGLAAGGDIAAPARGAAKASFKSIANTVFGLASDASQVAIDGIDFALAKTDMQLELDILNKELKFEHQQALKDVATMMRQEAPLRIEIYKQREVVNQTASRLQKLIAEGQRIIEQRTVWRRRPAIVTWLSACSVMMRFDSIALKWIWLQDTPIWLHRLMTTKRIS
jgi:PAS domain-containing protein